MRTTFDAVIVGAGPAGCAAAILLARAGWSVALVEQQAFPRRKVCGECIAASNGPLLDELGAGMIFEVASGPALRQVALMRGATCTTADLPPAPGARFRWGRAVGRETFDTLLRDRAGAAGATILQPWRVDACARRPDGWSCLVSTERGARAGVLEAPVLIDAHGSWSLLPGASAGGGTATAREPGDLFAFKANYTGASLSPGLLPVLSFPGGYGGMVVENAGITTVACCVRRDRLVHWRHAAPGVSAGDCVERALVAQCEGVRRTLERAVRVGPWLAAGPLQPGMRAGIDDGVLRIGNAAGEAHPILGEGISMALQSAALLVTQLRAAPTAGQMTPAWQRDAARAYAQAYRRAFGLRYRLAAVFAHAAMGSTSGAALATLARLCPALLTAGARWGGKVRSAIDVETVAAVSPPHRIA